MLSFGSPDMLGLVKEKDPFSWMMWLVVAQRSHCTSAHLMGLAFTTAAITKMLEWSVLVSIKCCYIHSLLTLVDWVYYVCCAHMMSCALCSHDLMCTMLT